MKEVRIGVIGCGGIGNVHMEGLLNKVTRGKLTAVADIDPDKLQATTKKRNVPGFNTAEELMTSGLVDAIVIATPHYDHPKLSIVGFKHGLHVLTEKPIAVTASAASEAIAAHRKYKHLVWSAMFQMRMMPVWRKVRQIVQDGQLGPIQRVNWIITNWFRSQAYYNSSSWRATWGGEGGGVLLNQCPHNLDLLQWITGMPNKISAQIALGKYHNIEVEDEVTAFLEYPNGATGVFMTSTGEMPGTNRFEIVGDRGRLICDGSPDLHLDLYDVSIREFCKTTPTAFPQLSSHKVTYKVEGPSPSHAGIMQNFIDAILDGTPLVAPAEEGLHGIELSNAMTLSGLTGKPVKVPADPKTYDRALAKLIKGSRFKKQVSKNVKVDMAASFR